jgi:Tol biopolymer transport system component
VWSSTAWSFQISEMLLVYLWPASDLADLYTLNPLTSEITRLTEGDAVRDFSASPDGKSIFYTADRLRGGSVIVRLSFDLTEAGAATSTETVATCENAVCRSPAASPNGRWLAFEKTPERGDRTQIGIWLLDMLSGESQPAGISGNPGRYPIWSAEGWLAYYDLTDQAYRAIHPESKSEILMPNQIGEQGSWRSDGSAFLASEIFDESSELLISAASGHMLLYSLKQPEDIVDLTREYYLEDTGGVIAPNGTQIAFTRKYLDPVRWTAGRQLWVMDIGVGQGESSSARPITDAPQYNHYGIAWSPDSQRIAYMRFNQVDLTQLPELWLINADGSNPTQLVIGGYAPQWVP